MSARVRSVPLVALALAIALVALASPRTARAIPAFARIHGVPCQTCHAPVITRRSEFGDAFRRAGFHWPTERRAVDGETPGDDPLELTGIAALDGALPETVPLSLLAVWSASYTNDAELPDPFVLGSPALRLLVGAPFGEHVSVFGTWSGAGAPDELYVHFARLAGRRELNLRLGLFEPSTTLFKNNEALLSRYLLSSRAINGFALSRARIGAEGNGLLGGRTFWAAGVVLDGEVGSSADFYYRIEQKIGGMNLRGEEPEIDLLAEPAIWESIAVSVSHWGYVGRVSDAEGNPLQLVRRAGLDLKLRVFDVTAWGGVMLGLDRDRVLEHERLNLTWFAEVGVPITSWLAAIYVLQVQDSETFTRAFAQHDLGLLMAITENLRARLRGSYTDDLVANEVVDLQLLLAI